MLANAVDYQKGYACIFGESGSGKTMVLNAYATHAWRGYVHAIKINGQAGGYTEFVQSILGQLRIETRGKEPGWLRRRLQLAAQLHRAKTKPLVLLVDNAHRLDDEVLSQLHLLIDSSAGQETVLQVVLAGTADLYKRLRSSILAPVNQRLVARAVLHPIPADDRIDFIHTIMNQKSMGPSYELPQRTLRRIARKSRGNPGDIVTLTKEEIRRLHAKVHPRQLRTRTESQLT